MSITDAVKLSGAFAVPLVAVAALFYGIMDKSLGPLKDNVRALREDVHELDVKMARVEEQIKMGSLLASQGKPVGPLFTAE